MSNQKRRMVPLYLTVGALAIVELWLCLDVAVLNTSQVYTRVIRGDDLP